ncbi:MAG TPA: HD domain-containing protein [Bacteroidales bacterium]|nr:HD domain-containing protein [Bacteroidales bacterium]
MEVSSRCTEITAWFRNYSASHLTGDFDADANIELKSKHSLRVATLASEIARSLGLSPAEIELAYMCGLLHDIGRFRQFKLYGSFIDNESTYHGSIGAEVFDSTPVPGIENPDEKAVIRAAIVNHGLLRVNPGMSDREQYFCNITRDADKADIFKIVTEYYLQTQSRNPVIELGLTPDGDISPDVLRSFHEASVVNKADMKSLDDFRILQLSWIFDINFEITLKQIINAGYTDIIISSISNKQHIAGIKDKIQERVHQINQHESI